MSMKNDPRVGHPPGTVDEALSWLNRTACGETGLHLVSLREAVRLVSRELKKLTQERDGWRLEAQGLEQTAFMLRERIDELEAAINEAAEYTSSAGIQHILCRAMKRDVPEWAK